MVKEKTWYNRKEITQENNWYTKETYYEIAKYAEELKANLINKGLKNHKKEILNQINTIMISDWVIKCDTISELRNSLNHQPVLSKKLFHIQKNNKFYLSIILKNSPKKKLSEYLWEKSDFEFVFVSMFRWLMYNLKDGWLKREKDLDNILSRTSKITLNESDVELLRKKIAPQLMGYYEQLLWKWINSLDLPMKSKNKKVPQKKSPYKKPTTHRKKHSLTTEKQEELKEFFEWIAIKVDTSKEAQEISNYFNNTWPLNWTTEQKNEFVRKTESWDYDSLQEIEDSILWEWYYNEYTI